MLSVSTHQDLRAHRFRHCRPLLRFLTPSYSTTASYGHAPSPTRYSCNQEHCRHGCTHCPSHRWVATHAQPIPTRPPHSRGVHDVHRRQGGLLRAAAAPQQHRAAHQQRSHGDAWKQRGRRSQRLAAASNKMHFWHWHRQTAHTLTCGVHFSANPGGCVQHHRHCMRLVQPSTKPSHATL